tara:strand:+ start:870 stop:1427 length:558 start_codon:yes stop_codon:yes gene_type:complete
MKKNIFYAQSGGVTPVINATASGIYDNYKKNKKSFGKLLIGKNGIAGAINEELIDLNKESKKEISKLIHTPGGAFGSCRIKLSDYKNNKNEYEKILNVFKKHNIGYFSIMVEETRKIRPLRFQNSLISKGLKFSVLDCLKQLITIWRKHILVLVLVQWLNILPHRLWKHRLMWHQCQNHLQKSLF